MHTENQLPATWDITIHRGGVWEYTGRIVQADGTLLDTEDFAMEFTIKESPEDNAPVIATYTTDNGRCLTGINTDSDGSEVDWWIKLLATDTEALPSGVYYHNIWLTPPDGASNRQAIFAGSCCIEQEVRDVSS